jgi:hypothetical protein
VSRQQYAVGVAETSTRPDPSPARQLAGLIARFDPAVAREARAGLTRLRRLVPAGAVRMVYDNWNGLVIGFGPTERASDAPLSLLVVADHVTLCFIREGSSLPDPRHLLAGSGSVVRHLRLGSARDLDRAPVKALIRAALQKSGAPFRKTGPSPLVIKSISARQRPRRKAR